MAALVVFCARFPVEEKEEKDAPLTSSSSHHNKNVVVDLEVKFTVIPLFPLVFLPSQTRLIFLPPDRLARSSLAVK